MDTLMSRLGVDDLTKLEQITTIWGTLIIANNTNIPDLKFLRYLRHIGEHALHGECEVLLKYIQSIQPAVSIGRKTMD
ncbi:hypothetical protein Y032_0180g793 [Ancylostoma ceylanicum]|nr:hypothetical protein Y032_0180g793 [Ancylostoma ceylanicum]